MHILSHMEAHPFSLARLAQTVIFNVLPRFLSTPDLSVRANAMGHKRLLHKSLPFLTELVDHLCYTCRARAQRCFSLLFKGRTRNGRDLSPYEYMQLQAGDILTVVLVKIINLGIFVDANSV